MYIQILIFILAFIGLYYFKDTGTYSQRLRARKRYVIFLMTLLTLQSGLRNVAVGGDTLAYYYMFDSVMASSWDSVLYEAALKGSIDPGYTILSKVFSMIIPSYRLYLIAIAVFFFTALGRLLYRYLNSNKDILVSIALYECLYYSFFSVTGLRQTIATAILFYALPLILNKRNGLRDTVHIFVLVILASTIHRSALLFAPVYFLPRIHNNKYVFLGTFAMFIPVFSIGSILGPILDNSDFERYAHYMEQSETTGAIVFSLYIVFLVLATFLKLKSINAYSQYNYVFTSAIAIAMLLTPLLMLNPNNQRIVQYYSIFGLFILPQICCAYSGRKGRTSLYIFVFVLFASYTIMRHEPYAFFWQDMTFGDSGQIVNDSKL